MSVVCRLGRQRVHDHVRRRRHRDPTGDEAERVFAPHAHVGQGQQPTRRGGHADRQPGVRPGPEAGEPPRPRERPSVPGALAPGGPRPRFPQPTLAAAGSASARGESPRRASQRRASPRRASPRGSGQRAFPQTGMRHRPLPVGILDEHRRSSMTARVGDRHLDDGRLPGADLGDGDLHHHSQRPAAHASPVPHRDDTQRQQHADRHRQEDELLHAVGQAGDGAARRAHGQHRSPCRQHRRLRSRARRPGRAGIPVTGCRRRAPAGGTGSPRWWPTR